jgi:glutathionyl-hydroquinone reductase
VNKIIDTICILSTKWRCRFSVPVLWDKKKQTIVNNESSEIIRMFNTAFNDLIPRDKAAVDIYPAAHRAEIDSLNEWVYDTVNSESGIPLQAELCLQVL